MAIELIEPKRQKKFRRKKNIDAKKHRQLRLKNTPTKLFSSPKNLRQKQCYNKKHVYENASKKDRLFQGQLANL
jgi:hypothetical protein